MKHDEQVRLLEELLARLDPGPNVDAGGVHENPTSAYTDPDRAEQEGQQFFRSHPQIIGLIGDLPEPGSVMTMNDLDPLPLLERPTT